MSVEDFELGTGPVETTPEALRLAWWVTAWLRGEAVTDLVLDAVIGPDATHTVSGLATLGLGGVEGVADTLVSGLGRLRTEGATAVGVAFPADGDPVGLGGPKTFNDAALEAGEAVVVSTGSTTGIWIGLVPVRVGAVLEWQAYAAQRRQLPDVGEADRALRLALSESATALAELDVARWRPEVADRLMNLRHRPSLAGAPGVPTRCVELAARGVQAREIVAVALEDEGGAVSASEMSQRRSALVGLDRAARRALTAAGSPEVWPPN